MLQLADEPSRFGHSLLEPFTEQPDQPREFERLWRGFMTARVTIGLVLLGLQGTIAALGAYSDSKLILICAAYFVAALSARLTSRPAQWGKTFNLHWISTIGVDVLAFASLQVIQGSNINYAPLLALPVLMASVLGSLLMALGAAASVSLLLLAYAAWLSVQTPLDTASHFLQAALAGAGCFAVSFLAHQIASRQANVELRAQRSQLAARVQKQVNELVIESLSDGILVVDQRRTVRAANPAARQLLGAESALQTQSFDLASMVGWQGLVDIMSLSFARQSPQSAAINIHHPGQGPRRLQVRTQLTATQDTGTGSLCVMFLKDLREIEAQMRADKLASMGRMSAAVAHEIRNPLAAISQANALLEEDISDPRHKQLTQMVQQNAKRLEKIVEEILNVSRLQHMDSASVSFALALNPSVERICRDWQQHSGIAHAFTVDAHPTPIEVRFEAEHLRQILINLLENARRYASGQAGAIQLWTELSGSAEAQLSVWSDGQPMDQSVERHLFEPFFSSESRSSGLGLYVCRELCERHGASIAYHRTTRLARGKRTEGNEFRVRFQSPQPAGSPHTAASAINTNA